MHDQIKDFIQSRKKKTNISNDQKLIDPMSGFMDSLDIAELVAWVEETYAIQIQPDDLNDANLGTINSIVALIKRYKTQA